jgi:hypothetical protein
MLRQEGSGGARAILETEDVLAGFYINPAAPEEAAQFMRDAGL